MAIIKQHQYRAHGIGRAYVEHRVEAREKTVLLNQQIMQINAQTVKPQISGPADFTTQGRHVKAVGLKHFQLIGGR